MARRWLRPEVSGRTPATVRSAASRSGVRVSTTSAGHGDKAEHGRGAGRAHQVDERAADGDAEPSAGLAQFVHRVAEARTAPGEVQQAGAGDDEQDRAHADVCGDRRRVVVVGRVGAAPAQDRAPPPRPVRRAGRTASSRGRGRQVGDAAPGRAAALAVDAEAGDDRQRDEQQACHVVGVVAEHPARRAQRPRGEGRGAAACGRSTSGCCPHARTRTGCRNGRSTRPCRRSGIPRPGTRRRAGALARGHNGNNATSGHMGNSSITPPRRWRPGTSPGAAERHTVTRRSCPAGECRWATRRPAPEIGGRRPAVIPGDEADRPPRRGRSNDRRRGPGPGRRGCTRAAGTVIRCPTPPAGRHEGHRRRHGGQLRHRGGHRPSARRRRLGRRRRRPPHRPVGRTGRRDRRAGPPARRHRHRRRSTPSSPPCPTAGSSSTTPEGRSG